MLGTCMKSLAWLALLALWAGCTGGESVETDVAPPTIRDVPGASWPRLAARKIFFGHQSVGFNILSGVNDLMQADPQIRLDLVETRDLADRDGGVFAHSRVGRNSDPYTKIRDFSEVVEHGVGGPADIAFFKFCYVDIGADTDVDKLFSAYQTALSELKAHYPETAFVHVTVPLCVTRTSWKTGIKKLLRRQEMWEYDDNVKRNEFNERLLDAYRGKEPVFDLAGVESTFPDGRRCSFVRGGKSYFSLVPEYTYDGGHLNETGRRKAAEPLLVLLAELAQAD
ncbi:MAG: hypothetical protein AB1640_14085 [bacterium]